MSLFVKPTLDTNSMDVDPDSQFYKDNHDYLTRAKVAVDPDAAWKLFSKEIVIKDVEPESFLNPKLPGHTRFVCISDTHGRTDNLVVPDGDILICAGDFTEIGKAAGIKKFSDFLKDLPHKHKVVIAGNHDISFDHESYETNWKRFHHSSPLMNAEELLQNCTYLKDQEITIEGFRIYGSPWQPLFYHWAFNLDRGAEIQEVWDRIPVGVDVLITHGPPLGHGDAVGYCQRAGCVNLLDTIENKVKPKLHVFGHIHEGYGITTNGTTIFANASICTLQYQPTNLPLIFDLPNILP